MSKTSRDYEEWRQMDEQEQRREDEEWLTSFSVTPLMPDGITHSAQTKTQ